MIINENFDLWDLIKTLKKKNCFKRFRLIVSIENYKKLTMDLSFTNTCRINLIDIINNIFYNL